MHNFMITYLRRELKLMHNFMITFSLFFINIALIKYTKTRVTYMKISQNKIKKIMINVFLKIIIENRR